MKMVLYTLPEGVDKSQIFYVVEDYAGNKDVLALSEFVSLKIQAGSEFPWWMQPHIKIKDTTFVYRIKDDKGKYVDLDKGKRYQLLCRSVVIQ